MKQTLLTFPLLSVFTAFSQSDSILIEKKLNEVIISAKKTNQTVNELPDPITNYVYQPNDNNTSF